MSKTEVAKRMEEKMPFRNKIQADILGYLQAKKIKVSNPVKLSYDLSLIIGSVCIRHDFTINKPCPFCGETMNGFTMEHYKCNTCNKNFTN